ncbi:hypothetical protein JXA40_10985 [bacterium]|nr:hypothetical protein [candidate division CSSED10-310 bacterium]
MKPDESKQLTCEEIIALVNGLLDKELTSDREKLALNLIRFNPQCRNLFTTLKKTIQLYRMRRSEIESYPSPKFDWDQLRKKSGCGQ